VGLALSFPWIDIICLYNLLMKSLVCGGVHIIAFSVAIANFPFEPLSPHPQGFPFPKNRKKK